MIDRTLNKIYHLPRYISERVYHGARYLNKRAKGVQWLFILGHMRTGSSLLVHILNSNPEILGYGETHLDYRGRGSLAKLHDHVCEQFERHGELVDSDTIYVMDKVLWPHIKNRSVLRVRPLKIVVIVRDPADALPSILSRDLDSIQIPEEALEYYVRTIRRVSRELRVYRRPFVLLEYGNLVNNTENGLKKITEYLDLDVPLTPEYELMWATGRKGIGDDTSVIYTERIQSSRSEYRVNLPAPIVSRGRDAYRSFVDTHKSSSFK